MSQFGEYVEYVMKAGRGTVTARNVFLARKNMKSYFLQFPKCKNIVWHFGSARFGELIHIILHFNEVGYVTQVIRIRLSVCAVLLFAQNPSHKLVHISLPFCSSAQDNKKKGKITPCTFLSVFLVRLLLLEESWKRLLVCAVSVFCAK